MRFSAWVVQFIGRGADKSRLNLYVFAFQNERGTPEETAWDALENIFRSGNFISLPQERTVEGMGSGVEYP